MFNNLKTVVDDAIDKAISENREDVVGHSILCWIRGFRYRLLLITLAFISYIMFISLPLIAIPAFLYMLNLYTNIYITIIAAIPMSLFGSMYILDKLTSKVEKIE